MCARSSFRRAHSDANGRRIVESGCAGAADGRCASIEHDYDESRGASGAYRPLGLPHNAFFDGFWAGVVRGHRRSRFGPLKNGGSAVHVVPHHVMGGFTFHCEADWLATQCDFDVILRWCGTRPAALTTWPADGADGVLPLSGAAERSEAGGGLAGGPAPCDNNAKNVT